MNEQIKKESQKIKCPGCGEMYTCQSPMTVQELKDSGQFPVCPDKAKKFIKPQSQQGIINPEKGSIINWAAVRDLLDVQSGITRKETLEEAIELINNDRSLFHPGQCVIKLQSLINKQ